MYYGVGNKIYPIISLDKNDYYIYSENFETEICENYEYVTYVAHLITGKVKEIIDFKYGIPILKNSTSEFVIYCSHMSNPCTVFFFFFQFKSRIYFLFKDLRDKVKIFKKTTNELIQEIYYSKFTNLEDDYENIGERICIKNNKIFNVLDQKNIFSFEVSKFIFEFSKISSFYFINFKNKRKKIYNYYAYFYKELHVLSKVCSYKQKLKLIKKKLFKNLKER